MAQRFSAIWCPGCDPGDLGLDPKSGSLHGACFSLCLSLSLSLSLSINQSIFKKKNNNNSCGKVIQFQKKTENTKELSHIGGHEADIMTACNVPSRVAKKKGTFLPLCPQGSWPLGHFMVPPTVPPLWTIAGAQLGHTQESAAELERQDHP